DYRPHARHDSRKGGHLGSQGRGPQERHVVHERRRPPPGRSRRDFDRGTVARREIARRATALGTDNSRSETRKTMIDIFLIAIVAVVTWCVASEGAWGAALTLFSVVFAGLLAMN